MQPGQGLIEARQGSFGLGIHLGAENVQGPGERAGVDPGGAQGQRHEADRHRAPEKIGRRLGAVIGQLASDERRGLAVGDGEVVDDQGLPCHGHRAGPGGDLGDGHDAPPMAAGSGRSAGRPRRALRQIRHVSGGVSATWMSVDSQTHNSAIKAS